MGLILALAIQQQQDDFNSVSGIVTKTFSGNRDTFMSQSDNVPLINNNYQFQNVARFETRFASALFRKVVETLTVA